MGAHAKLSPSASHRWMLCPGSVALCSGIPRRESPDALRGTAMHALAEDIFKGKPKWHTYTKDGTSYGISHEDIEIVEQAVANAKRLTAVYGTVECETKVSVTDDLWGTADIIAYTPFSGILVGDYKFGKGVEVEAKDNPQGLIYGLAAAEAMGGLALFPAVTIAIIQPAFGAPKTWTISSKQLGYWRDEVLLPAAAKAIEGGDLVPGEKQCKFCDAKSVCPAISDWSMAVAQQDFAGYVQPVTAAPPPIDRMTPEQVSYVLTVADTIRAWLDAVEARAMDTLAGGGHVPGWKRVAGRRGARKWRSEDDAITALKGAGIDPYEHKLVSPSGVEKAAKLAGLDIAGLVVQADGKPSLVPESDKRPALIVDAVADFAGYR